MKPQSHSRSIQYAGLALAALSIVVSSIWLLNKSGRSELFETAEGNADQSLAANTEPDFALADLEDPSGHDQVLIVTGTMTTVITGTKEVLETTTGFVGWTELETSTTRFDTLDLQGNRLSSKCAKAAVYWAREGDENSPATVTTMAFSAQSQTNVGQEVFGMIDTLGYYSLEDEVLALPTQLVNGRPAAKVSDFLLEKANLTVDPTWVDPSSLLVYRTEKLNHNSQTIQFTDFRYEGASFVSPDSVASVFEVPVTASGSEQIDGGESKHYYSSNAHHFSRFNIYDIHGIAGGDREYFYQRSTARSGRTPKEVFQIIGADFMIGMAPADEDLREEIVSWSAGQGEDIEIKGVQAKLSEEVDEDDVVISVIVLIFEGIVISLQAPDRDSAIAIANSLELLNPDPDAFQPTNPGSPYHAVFEAEDAEARALRELGPGPEMIVSETIVRLTSIGEALDWSGSRMMSESQIQADPDFARPAWIIGIIVENIKAEASYEGPEDLEPDQGLYYIYNAETGWTIEQGVLAARYDNNRDSLYALVNQEFDIIEQIATPELEPIDTPDEFEREVP